MPQQPDQRALRAARPSLRFRPALFFTLKLLLAGAVLSWLLACFFAWTTLPGRGSVGIAAEIVPPNILTSAQTSIGPVSVICEISWEAGGKRDWGPEQAAGPPDTQSAGDQATTWAPATAEGELAWLRLEWAAPIQASHLHVHQTFNAGAITRIDARLANQPEQIVWTPAAGDDPGAGVLVVPLEPRMIDTVILHLDPSAVPGWNEIDAVGLRDAASRAVHFAAVATASSTYADRHSTGSLAEVVPDWATFAPPLGGASLKPRVQQMRTTGAFGWPMKAWVATGPMMTQPPPGPRPTGLVLFSQQLGPSPLRAVPLRPLLLGVIVNAVASAGALAILYFALIWPFFPIRKVLRMQRGCCPECGFDLRYAFAAGCPECGFLRS
jgi:hypothetical protein